MAELLVSVGENGGGVGSLRDAKELFGEIVRAPWRRRERRRKQLILLKKGGGGAGICTQSVRGSRTCENARSSGQTADAMHFRRLHRFLRTPIEYPGIHPICGGILEAPGVLPEARSTGRYCGRISTSRVRLK